MPTTRISDTDHRVLQNLATKTGKQHQEIIHEALDTYQRERLLDEINEGFGRLRADKASWAAVKAERRLLEAAGADGLGD
jgi:predicted transcriptional regulator